MPQSAWNPVQLPFGLLGYSVVSNPEPTDIIAMPNSRKRFQVPNFITIIDLMIEVRTSEMTVDRYSTPLEVGMAPRMAWNRIGSQYTIVWNGQLAKRARSSDQGDISVIGYLWGVSVSSQR